MMKNFMNYAENTNKCKGLSDAIFSLHERLKAIEDFGLIDLLAEVIRN